MYPAPSVQRLLPLALLITACGQTDTVGLDPTGRPQNGEPADAGGVGDGGTAQSCEAQGSEASCLALGCIWDVCRDCDGNVLFATCAGSGGLVPTCPEISCPPCNALGEEACAAASDCHRVFRDDALCDCQSPGCCAYFDRCADGAQADCRGENLGCRAAEPYCEGPYVVSYEGTCYEGCVLSEDCS